MKNPLKYGLGCYIDFQKLHKSGFEKYDVLSGQHFSLNCLINMTFQPLWSIFVLKMRTAMV